MPSKSQTSHQSDRLGGPLSGKAVVVLPILPSKGAQRREASARLHEGCGLARAIQLDVVKAEAVTVARPRAATLLGLGVVERLKCEIADVKAKVVIVDASLTPIQQRNLELAWDCKVIDRTGLILEIFGARAHTKEGSLQVEFAALSYQRSRLVRSWTHLERQRGGFGFLGGPGETQIEADRRQIDTRISRIKVDLENVRRTRGLHRKARKRTPFPTIAFVGYTNAGKSTLFNNLTAANVKSANLLFATLDPTMRAVELPSGRRVILSDTVGFISDLPTDLIAAFRATLEEVLAADIVVHVRDISHIETESQKSDVEKVLSELGLDISGEGTMIEALNKIDILAPEEKDAVLKRALRDPNLVAVSALGSEGIDDFLETIDRRLASKRRIYHYRLGPAEGAAIAWLYEHGEVLERDQRADGTARICVRLDPVDAERFGHDYEDINPLTLDDRAAE